MARDLITPDIRMTMSGYGSYCGTQFKGIHDDLYVKALWMNDGTESLLLVTLDLLFHDLNLTDEIKEYVGARYRMKPDFVVVSYTHTHSGPAIKGYDLGQHSDQYEQFLKARIGSCIDRLFHNTFEGYLSYGKIQGEWNINRRRLVDGVMRNAPNPEGITDNALHLLKITDLDGKIKGLFLNYACHPVTIRDTLYLSGDFPGRICQNLETDFYGSTAMFFQGAGGNSRPMVTAKGSEFLTRTFDEIEDMSITIANRIRNEIGSGKFEAIELRLAAKQFMIPVELEIYDRAVFEAAANDETNYPTLRNGAAYVQEHYDEMADHILLHGGIVQLNGEYSIALLGGEPCVEVKLNIARAFEGKTMMFIGYTDSIAYIPDDKIIAEGGYEGGEAVFEMALKGKFKPGIDNTILTAFRNHAAILAKPTV